MKTMYIDCQMGVAGDMLLAALLELIEDKHGFLEQMHRLGIPGFSVSCEKVVREGYEGTQAHVSVAQDDYLEGRSLADVHAIIDTLLVSDAVKQNAKGVYQIIAEAETVVHETDLEHVHFHEVGSLRAIADITGVCLLMDALKCEQIIASPIHAGCGTVRCSHGILPVPAPATARILQDMPYYGGEVQGELCTPTGAALLKYFVHHFDEMPKMTVSKVGRGFGTKVFPGRVNGIGVTLGDCF